MLIIAPAWALQVELVATVSADLRRIEGTLRTDEPVTLQNPLAALPDPPDDRSLFRTFPGPIDRGVMVWERGSPLPVVEGGREPGRGAGETWTFTVELPVRFGDVGVTPGDGLWANGGWYPQPVDASGRARVATWRVDVAFPEGVGVLNGVVGQDRLAWAGESDRAALAIVLGARVYDVPAGRGAVRIVERAPRVARPADRPPPAERGYPAPEPHARQPLVNARGGAEPAMRRYLARAVAEGWPLDTPPFVTVVEDRDLLRLARPAPGMIFLSERTFRLQPGFLDPYHLGAVHHAVAAAALQQQPGFADGWVRDFGAAALTNALPAPSAGKLLGWFSWNPVVDALLYDGTLPFFSDVFDEAFPTPSGIFERLGGRIPGGAAAAQVDDLAGEGTAVALTRALLAAPAGELGALATARGVPAEVAAGWSSPYDYGQDYVVVVDGVGARVERRARPDAPAEVVVVKVDGQGGGLGANDPLVPRVWVAGPGADALPIDGCEGEGCADVERRSGVVERVEIGGHIKQAELSNDRWPNRWTLVVNGGLYNLTPSQHAFDLSAQLYLRQRNDSRNLFVIGADHDAQDIVSVDIGWVRYLGRLVDRRTRAHRLSFFAGPSLLDPAYRPTDQGAIAIGGGIGYSWDTRTDDFFALSGHRLSVGVGGGFVPQSVEQWASASLIGIKLVSPHPRHVFAFKAKAGWSSGDVEHRLLPLGGGSDVRGVPEPAVVANERVSANIEYRWAVFRNASLPLPLLYLSELHLSPGLDAGVAWRGADRFAAVGATLGVHVLSDFLGARPSLTGVTIAQPLWTEGFEATDTQLYVDFFHAF